MSHYQLLKRGVRHGDSSVVRPFVSTQMCEGMFGLETGYARWSPTGWAVAGLRLSSV
jgi:hypothetical protein